ncbi:spore germination lipoprotein GerD [Halobacillus salinarum]|uniref:Spore germination lipoprotein GerD n=1 Tax=Halobacillus salinarum TaxID=2932257 RepID=A0ABY4EK69_9BACI|nr:spore germination lipoprotein GerD [Halobacillus salinarum]UOQ44569.1 spore germination lipoprotein GerD [Halobacillus salinarum]
MSRLYMLCPVLLLVFLAACSGSSGASQQADYDTTKKMIVDILKTDDGKKAMTEVLADKKMQEAMALDSEAVSQAINKTLISEEGKEFWSKLFSDPTFVQGFSKVIEKEQKDLMKGLMKDPEYQKSLIELYKNPEMMNEMVTVMQGQKFRSHLQSTIEETINSPVFQAKMSESLLKAAEKIQSKQGQGSSGGQQGQGGQQGGGQSGGQGEESSTSAS